MEPLASKIKPKAFTFQAAEETLSGSKFVKDEQKPTLLFLHGAGQSSSQRTYYLMQRLLEEGVSSIGFDFSGSGESSGRFKESSLKKRVEEARLAMSFLNLEKPISICGSSMGAYAAIKLLESFDIKNLILFCPAVYDKRAYNLKFAGSFSDIIRKDQSWRNSDAFEILKTFKGRLLVFIGSNDEIIPEGVIDLITSASTHAAGKEIVKIPGAPHALHRWLSQNATITDQVVGKIAKLVT